MSKKTFLLFSILFFCVFIFTSYANESRWYWINSDDYNGPVNADQY